MKREIEEEEGSSSSVVKKRKASRSLFLQLGDISLQVTQTYQQYIINNLMCLFNIIFDSYEGKKNH